MRVKKPRKRRINLMVLRWAVELASLTSANNAERAFGLTSATIRTEMRRLRIPIRRAGSYTLRELDTFGPLLLAA